MTLALTSSDEADAGVEDRILENKPEVRTFFSHLSGLFAMRAGILLPRWSSRSESITMIVTPGERHEVYKSSSSRIPSTRAVAVERKDEAGSHEAERVIADKSCQRERVYYHLR